MGYCTMKIATKVKMIGWLDFIGALVCLIGFTVLYTNLAVCVTETEDRVIGRQVLQFYNETKNEGKIESDTNYSEGLVDYVQENIYPQDDEILKKFKLMLIPCGIALIPENEELVGMKVKSRLIDMFGTVVTMSSVAAVVYSIAGFTLLIGAYTKKRGFLLPWLVLSYFCLVGMILLGVGFLRAMPIMSSQIPVEYYIFFLIAAMTRLNMILDIHFFMREIKRQTPKYTGQLVSTLNGDEPLIISMGLPDHCFDPKK